MDGQREIVAVARLASLPGRDDAEVALVVSDSLQQHGLGTELCRRLIQAAKDAHLTRLGAKVLIGNVGMLRLCAKLGTRVPNCELDGEVKAALYLCANSGQRNPACA